VSRVDKRLEQEMSGIKWEEDTWKGESEKSGEQKENN